MAARKCVQAQEAQRTNGSRPADATEEAPPSAVAIWQEACSGSGDGSEQVDPSSHRLHPETWMRKRFPRVLPEHGYAFDVTEDGKIRGLGPDFVLAECLGRRGSPDAPVVFCPEKNSFYAYAPEEGLYHALQPDEVTDRIDRVLERCAQHCDRRHRKRVHGVRRLPWLKRIREALRAKSRLPAARFRQSTESLHVENGVLDLRELELQSFSPEKPARWKLDVAWSQDPDSPKRFVRFLKALFPQPEDRDLALTVMAMALLGNPFQKVVILIGPGGSGKSTLVKLMEELVGPEHATQLNLPHADERFQSAEWEGKLLLHQEEADNEMLRKNSRVLKALSGGDRIAAERKYQQERTRFTPRAVPVLSSNERLRLPLDGDESAWKRRLLVLETSCGQVPEEERIPDFEQKLLKENGTGILRLVAGRAQRLLRRLERGRGFPELAPRQVARMHRLLKNSDPFGYFVKQRVERCPDAELHAGALKEAYRCWLKRHDAPVPANVQVTKEIRELVAEIGGVYAKSLPEHPEFSARGWRGVALR